MSTRLAKLQQQLISKCKEVDIDCEIREYPDGENYVVVHMPNGRDKRPFFLSSIEKIEAAIDLEFEKYVFLGPYAAIANYEENTIEAIIRPANRAPSSFFLKRLFGKKEEDENIQPIIITDENNQNISIEIGKASDVLRLFSRGPFGRSSAISLKISGINVSQHNKGLNLLRRLSDSLFFQLDLQSEMTLSLVRDFRPLRRPYRKRPNFEIDLQFPKVEYDEGPISLYWYAKNALGMPLLQFLAYYQVIEYYYPTYSQEEARRRIRAILKDPAFRSDRDADIGRVLSILSGGGRGLGDEKSQLRATLNACVDPSELRSFFEEEETRVEFFSKKQKGLTNKKLPISSKDSDLRNHVADLIYDIRCKIVHTKAENIEGEVELLLPFTKEADLLIYDIEMMKFVARKVLIAASAPINI